MFNHLIEVKTMLTAKIYKIPHFKKASEGEKIALNKVSPFSLFIVSGRERKDTFLYSRYSTNKTKNCLVLLEFQGQKQKLLNFSTLRLFSAVATNTVLFTGQKNVRFEFFSFTNADHRNFATSGFINLKTILLRTLNTDTQFHINPKI